MRLFIVKWFDLTYRFDIIYFVEFAFRELYIILFFFSIWGSSMTFWFGLDGCVCCFQQMNLYVIYLQIISKVYRNPVQVLFCIALWVKAARAVHYECIRLFYTFLIRL